MIKDLTTGSPGKTLLAFSAPLLISAAFQQFYNMADSIIAGKFVGTDALAAIGASYPVTTIIIAIAVGLNTGCSVIISQYFGSKKIKAMKSAVYTSLVTALVVAAVLTILGIIFSSFMLSALNTPENIFAGAKTYLDIYIFGLFSLVIYNICTGVFAALGDSKTPLYFLVCSSIGNVFLDIFMVVSLDMGIAGLAWATFIAQSIAALLAFVVLMQRVSLFKTEEKAKIFSGNIFKRLMSVAIPSILQQSFVSVGTLFIQALVNGFGSDVIAGYSAAIKLNTFAVVCVTTLGSGISSFSAQNYGAGRMDRVHQGFKAGLKMMTTITATMAIISVVFAHQLMTLFVDPGESAVIHVGIMFLRIVAPFYVIVGIKVLSDGTIRGTGKMVAFMVSTFTDLILRVVLSYIFVIFIEETGIWLSWPVGWTAGMIVSLIFYKVYVLSDKAGMKSDEMVV